MTRIILLFSLALMVGCGASYAGSPGMESYAMEPEGGDVSVADVAELSPGEVAEASGSEVTTAASNEGADASAGNLVATTVTTHRRGGGGDGERDPNDPIQIPDLPAPLLIYTANMRLEVPAEDVAPTIERIIEGAVSLGGYLAGRTDTSVTVRIPSRLFREGLADVEQMGEVKSRQVTAQDVSEEYHDLDVRLQNLRALRQRLESFLSRATSIEEALRVQSELERVAMQIDQAEGRLRFLRSRVAFSVVSVQVTPAPVVVAPPPQEVVVEAPPPPPPPRRPGPAAHRVARSHRPRAPPRPHLITHAKEHGESHEALHPHQPRPHRIRRRLCARHAPPQPGRLRHHR